MGTMKKPFFTEKEWEWLQEEISNGYVNVGKHPTEELYIYNYSHQTQYDWHWNPITIKCRGLILDANGCLVAKGFDKFFTDDQLKSAGEEHLIPKNEPFTISDKVDGSLGVMYFVDDEPFIATRGSFVSEMAVIANEWLRGQYGHIMFNPNYTYMFEIIYPENRIVVDYGGERKLVLLAVLDNKTLTELDINSEEFDIIELQGLMRAMTFDGFTDWRKILASYEGDKRKEGFVVHFLLSDYRVKMKLSWYKEAAYVLQYFTKKTIWRMIRDGQDVDEVIKNIDDEFYPTIRGYYDELWVDYNKIVHRHEIVHDEIVDNMQDGFTRKDFALKVKDVCTGSDTSADLVMRIHKKQDLFTKIWRSIEPKGTDHSVLENI